MGDIVILGGGGESTSNSDEDELERDRLWLLDRDRDLVLVTLKFEGESHVISDLAWYTPLSSSSDSGFSINRFTPNLISSCKEKQMLFIVPAFTSNTPKITSTSVGICILNRKAVDVYKQIKGEPNFLNPKQHEKFYTCQGLKD